MRGGTFETEECRCRHHHFRVAVSVGEAGLGIEFGVVFDQGIKSEGGFAQFARDGLLVEAQVVIRGGLRQEGHSTALQQRAVIRRQHVDGHVEAHPIGGTGLAAAIDPAERETGSIVDQIDDGRPERLFTEAPVGDPADVAVAQPR